MPFKQFHIKSVVLFLLLLLTGAKVEAQVYPVQVTVIPTPPHRNYLNSFSEQGALNVFVTLTDFNSGPISVKLKFTLNGPGYQFRSLPNNLVYVLNPGQPTQIPMEDLAVFFSSTGQSLNFNPSKLPEGNSSICIDVIKNQSGELLSNNGCGYFYMSYGQPANLIQPTCNTTIAIPSGFPASTDLRTIPLQFNFSPALAPIGLQQEVENTLYIYNWLGTVNNNPPLIPIGLPLAMDPIELGQITAHTLLPINNQLIVGQEYVWYVKSTLNGSTNQFQNGGWSIPCKFKYGEAQSIEESLAQGLSVEWINLVSQSESKGAASWKVVKEDPNSSATFNQFILKYRRKVSAGQEPYEWFSDTVNDLSKAIYQLEPATTYEASVAGKLGSFVSTPTEIRTFTTAPPRTFSCGVANFPGRATAFQPLQFADPGMKVKIGMFQLEFVSVQNTGQPGRFSGTGLIPVDFLFGAEARVKFDNLKIDKEYDVWEGTAHVITDGLDAWLEDQYQQFQDPIFVNGTVDSAYVSDSLAHVVIDGVDTTFTFPCTTCPVIINDVAGNQITIYPNGTVIWSSYLDVSDEQLSVPESEIAVFEQNTQETGGFDPFEHIEWNANYEIIRTSDAVNYFVANKSLKKGQTDKVSLSVPENKYTETNVKLSWSGLTNPLTPTSNTISGGKRVFVFDLPVFNNEDEFAIYAVSDSSKKIGKLNVTVFELLQKKVVVVPIAGTVDGPQLSTYLKKTLGEAGINFTVSISDTIGVGKYAANSSINIPDATLMAKYSGKMRQIRNSYFDKHESEDDTYYLFVVSSLMDTVNNLPADGYMVRGKSIGFIQNGATLQTYAHELGHGMGALEHTWKDNGPEKGSSNNLMDYTEGENLILAQWKALREPKGNSFWDEEEDNENIGGLVAYYFWEEEHHSTLPNGDVHTFIKDENVIMGFKKNTELLIRTSVSSPYSQQSTIENQKSIVVHEITEGNAYEFVKRKPDDLKSIIYFKDHLNVWQSVSRPPVLYFEVVIKPNNEFDKKFLFANENVILSQENVDIKATTHLVVKKFVHTNGTFSHYKIYDFIGKDVTYQYLSTTKNAPKRYLVFSNGYRGPGQNWYESDGLVTTDDRYSYWAGIDNRFMSKSRLNIEEKNTYYIDGSFRIWTSNHHTMGSFASSMERINAGLAQGFSGPGDLYWALNATPEIDGFNYRKYQGKLAGKAFLSKIKGDPRSQGVMDTVDIVAHSMGYAYAVGFVEEIKTQVHLGRLYIIAPENACSGGNDWALFEEVWQYGSNNNPEDQDNANALIQEGTRDPYWKQDGIAPQCGVLGIDPLPGGVIGGRVYIPKTVQMPGGMLGNFGGCHSIGNYTWIFSLMSSQLGYVKKR